MKYREAKGLNIGDEIFRKEDNLSLIVKDIEVYGQFKKVKINCIFDGIYISIFNDEVK